MIIKDMFKKDIERDIRGVVKVAQTEQDDIYQELDEYVVTKELKKHFSTFYENYVKSIHSETDKMGVWVSGFFGSGKSHFLKILSYLLANKPVNGEYPVDFFESKIDNALVFANMEKSASVDTETILFNIDAKSSTGYSSKDAILRVFKKVFDEHRGYYGDNPGISRMEKFLDDENTYETFKNHYEQLAEEPWEGNQNNFYFRAEEIIESLVHATDMKEENARNWFENIDSTDDLTIESFAEEVKEYIETKGEDAHLVFLVDEIGQYIGDNRNLMLNLQTVVENLGAKSNGKVWVIVTSQESIDSIVKVKGDDFSRIQGRFDTKLSLSSISADEVIKERILGKKEFVTEKLQASYHEFSPILSNLISFRGATGTLRGYEDALEFSEDYPFLPYQFKLLQNIFEQVRKHGSSGKHLSEGERSMLSAFQEAAQVYKNEKEGILVPLYVFYETISEFLNPSITRVINGALSNPELDNDTFNTDLLKVLFMIKYIDDIPGNIDNLATLMVTDINEDKTILKQKIQEAIQKLRQERLIQKNGDNYEFLTDEEQDVNREIQQIDIDELKVINELSEEIFDSIYPGKKYQYSKHYSFPFNQQLDTVNHGSQTANINLKVISAQSPEYDLAEQELMMQTMDAPDLLVKLGGDDSYVEEVVEVLKIERYRSRKNIKQLSETKQNIINSKQAEVRERRRRIKNLLNTAIKEAKFYVNGSNINVTGSTPREKINNGLNYLVENTYSKLNMIDEHLTNQRELKEKIITEENISIFENTEELAPNSTALSEMQEYIRLQDQMNKQITIKRIYEHFSDIPYGWSDFDLAGLLIDLLKEEKIRIRYNSEYLNSYDSQSELLKVFTNNQQSAKAIVLKREKVDAALIGKVKRLSRDLFDRTSLPEDEDGLMQTLQNLIDDKKLKVNSYKQHYINKDYPGQSLLNKGLEYFERFNSQLDTASFFNKFVEMEDDLLLWEEDYSYVEDFFNTNQKQLFDNALDVLEKYKRNDTYLQSEEIKNTVDQLEEIVNNPIPYSEIKNIPGLVNQFNNNFEETLTEMRKDTKEKIESDLTELFEYSDHEGVSNTTENKFEQSFNKLVSEVEESTDIYKIDAITNQSERNKEIYYREISREINEYNQEDESTDENISPDRPKEQKIEKIQLSKMIPTNKLSDEDEVDNYVNALSKKLKKILKENKTIEIID